MTRRARHHAARVVVGSGLAVLAASLLAAYVPRPDRIATLHPGVLTVAVTTASPASPFDSQLWIRRYVERFASEERFAIAWVVVPFNESWTRAGAGEVDLVATNVASFPDRVSPGAPSRRRFSTSAGRSGSVPRSQAGTDTSTTSPAGASASYAARRPSDVRRRAPEGMEVVTEATFPELYGAFDAGTLDAIAEAEYYALDGTVIPSHGSEVVLVDLHDLTPGPRQESVLVVRDASTGLRAAVNAFIARTRFPVQ